MPRLGPNGLLAGFEPNTETGTSRVIVYRVDPLRAIATHEDARAPFWVGNRLHWLPQSEAYEVRSESGSPIRLSFGPVSAESDGDSIVIWGPGRLAWVIGGAVREFRGFHGGVPCEDHVIALRHADGALCVLRESGLAGVLSDRPHDSLRAVFDPLWAGVGRQWQRGADGQDRPVLAVVARNHAVVTYPELGPAWHPSGADGYVCWTRSAANGIDSELCLARLDMPTEGWVVASGDIRYPDLRLLPGNDKTMVLVWCNGRGELGTARVNLLTPKVSLRRVAAPAPPPQAEEIWRKTDEQVDLWQLFVGASPSQYPRRNPEDPGVFWDCQRVNLGASEHAFFVKVASGLIWEWRATWQHTDGIWWIGLIEDHDEHGRIYRFEDPRLMPRYVRAGETFYRATRIAEWDHAKSAWGPWSGPGSDGMFRFRVRIDSVERSSLGRLRAVVLVDTYQDLEIFELYSNKGWSAWEEYTKSEAERGGRPVRVLPEGTRVARTKRVEWPERVDLSRQWACRPRAVWPVPEIQSDSGPTRVTIIEPSSWPVEGAERALRCVYALSGGRAPHRVRWTLTTDPERQRVAQRVENDGSDYDHTFTVSGPGEYYVWLEALDAAGKVVDATGVRRKWVVTE
jgi:hypothetical protein